MKISCFCSKFSFQLYPPYQSWHRFQSLSDSSYIFCSLAISSIYKINVLIYQCNKKTTRIFKWWSFPIFIFPVSFSKLKTGKLNLQLNNQSWISLSQPNLNQQLTHQKRKLRIKVNFITRRGNFWIEIQWRKKKKKKQRITLTHKFPVQMMCWIFPGTSIDLNFAGRSGALCGIWRSPNAKTSTISPSKTTRRNLSRNQLNSTFLLDSIQNPLSQICQKLSMNQIFYGHFQKNHELIKTSVPTMSSWADAVCFVGV